jgi:two-component system chemotaxis sensor kinase CheA
MDVVRANVERLGGMIDVDSRIGEGTRLTMRLPLTLTIIPALIVGCGDSHFAVPRSAIDEIVRVGRGDVALQSVAGGIIATIRCQSLPVVDLAGFLRLGKDTSRGPWPVLVVVRAGGGERFALLVDAVLDHEELVVKPAAPAIMATGIYAGTTLPDNSRPILLFDVVGLAAAAGITALTEAPADEAAEGETEASTISALLFRDLDGMQRAVRLGLVERIEDVAREQVAETGGRLHLAHQDAIVPLMAAGPLPDSARLRILQLGDGESRLAYAVDSVVEVVELPARLSPPAVPGPIAGVALLNGRQVELLDGYWLFGQRAEQAAARPLTCLIADDQDPWARQFLEPLLAAAGHRVLFGSIERTQAVDVVICGAGEPAAPAADPSRCVRLRTAQIARDGEEASIWRYDRTGLLDAVAVAARGGK